MVIIVVAVLVNFLHIPMTARVKNSYVTVFIGKIFLNTNIYNK